MAWPSTIGRDVPNLDIAEFYLGWIRAILDGYADCTRSQGAVSDTGNVLLIGVEQELAFHGDDGKLVRLR